MKTRLYIKMIFILLGNFISKQAIAQYGIIDANNIKAETKVYLRDSSNNTQAAVKGNAGKMNLVMETGNVIAVEVFIIGR